MPFSSKFLAFILLCLGVPCLLPYDSVAKILPHIQTVHATPISQFFRKEKLQPFERRIVAVGDLHGDYENTIEVLKFSEVIDDAGDWSGKVDFFVQTGDIIDRGADTIKLYDLMERLRVQAKKHAKGGTVVSIMGNHEWMNAIGDWRGCTESEYMSFEGAGVEDDKLDAALGHPYQGESANIHAIRRRMFAIYNATGSIGEKWAKNYTSAARLPLHPFLGELNAEYDKNKSPPKHELSHAALSFVHGGLSPTYDDRSPFPTKINELSKSLLDKLQARHPPPIPYMPSQQMYIKLNPDGMILPKDASAEEKKLYDPKQGDEGSDNGPIWYRGWATNQANDDLCKDADKVLEETGTRRMIMGHTTNVKGIVSRCKGKVIVIDTGISKAYGGVLSALSIHYTLEPKEKARRSKDQLWDEREVVTALYGGLNGREDKVIAEETRTIQGNFRRSRFRSGLKRLKGVFVRPSSPTQ